MSIILNKTKLIGLALENKTSNLHGQSGFDCGNLWQKFEKGDYASKIPGRISEEIVAVYHQYEGDYTHPFSYFIGCKVKADTEVPEGMTALTLPEAKYQKFVAKGTMPACIAKVWKEIWNSGIQRAYTVDFEIYDKRSKNWNDAEVDIYISII